MRQVLSTFADGATTEQIATALGLHPNCVHRIEREALSKLAIGLALVELLGRARAEQAFASLCGRDLSAWRRALVEARSSGLRRPR